MTTRADKDSTERFLSMEFEEYTHAISSQHFQALCQRMQLSEEFIEEYLYKLDMADVCMYQQLSERFLRAHIAKINIAIVVGTQTLSDAFIREFVGEKHMGTLCRKQQLSEQYLWDHSHLLRYDLVCSHQTPSEGFLRTFRDRIDWEALYENESIQLSAKFIRDFKGSIVMNAAISAVLKQDHAITALEPRIPRDIASRIVAFLA